MNLKERLKKYPGFLGYKELYKPIDKDLNDSFKHFIRYAKDNFSYNEKVISNFVRKLSGEKLNKRTNCGEIAVLSLIQLKLLPSSVLNEHIYHHLLYVVKLKKLINNKYNDTMQIYINPF